MPSLSLRETSACDTIGEFIKKYGTEIQREKNLYFSLLVYSIPLMMMLSYHADGITKGVAM